MTGVYRRLSGGSRWVACVLCLASLVYAEPGKASLPEDAYNVDLQYGLLLGSRRVLGLGGAYTAVAEGNDGLSWTPAAYANRPRNSFDRTDFSVGLSLGGVILKTVDLDGDGEPASEEQAYGNRHLFLAGQIYSGDFGFGAFWNHLEFVPRGSGARLRAIGDTACVGAGWSISDGLAILGTSLGIHRMSFSSLSFEGGLLPDLNEVSYQRLRVDLGLLIRPPWLPVRLGLSFRPGGRLREVGGIDADSLVRNRPATLVVPDQLSVGVSLMLGPGSVGWNHAMGDSVGWGEGIRIADSRYVLLSAEYGYHGPAPANTLSMESFLVLGSQEGADASVEESVAGASPAFRVLAQAPRHTLRVGAESELLADMLRVRLGSYLAPNLYEASFEGSLHLTGGVDIRLFRLGARDIRASLSFDVGDAYLNLGLGLGLWEPPYTLKRAVGIPSTLPEGP